ncbi:response regulator [Ramlibacter sp. G-1-2-2]|uniref:Virulence sensor protein BvgS n=1 Tax=Ramlibacter agri TaxID=2728837 RepID=A0A848H954_9BURK|nr:ATP-binding protein [Ramlibacter agri]NML45053.1 response regulator [Ramlibacter agri]
MQPKDILRWTAFAAIYFAMQAIPTTLYGDIPAMRGANAVAVFALLVEPRRHWRMLAPLLWLAASAARVVAQAPQPWLVGACNVLEMFAVAAVLHGPNGLSSPWYGREQLGRLLLAVGAVPLLSAAGATAVLSSGAGMPVGSQWLAWYLASFLAYIILTPVLLTWTDADVRQRTLQRARGSWRPAGIAVIALACVALLRQELHPPLLLLTFPLLVLTTWWYGLAGATTAIAALSITGSFMAMRGVGALSHLLPLASALPARMQALQVYLAATAMCSLPFAVLLAQQELLWAQLRRKSDARAEFLAAMSHEIRTPMTGVLGMADLLAAQDLTAEQRRYVDAMRASGRHLVSVINDILDFSRIETGKLALETVDFRLAEVVEQVRSLLHPIAMEKGLAFELEVAPEAQAVVRGDPTRLRQVLLNLAGNAVKFTPKGSVRLEVTVEAGRYRFKVRDTGIGIPPDKLRHLFTPFTQADRSTAREFGGSGLGLAISRRLAEAMGGQISVASLLGQGSVFTLEVPFEPGDPEYGRAEAAASIAAALPLRILVAEDVQINRDILQAVLGSRGHDVVFAHDGAAAVACVKQQAFDLVLMDVQMPVMDGVEATRRIRAMPGMAGRVPIIGLTANVMSQEQARYLEAGMDDCLTKPIEWDRLHAAIARFASGDGEADDFETLESDSPPEDVPLLATSQIASLRSVSTGPEFRMIMHKGMHNVERTLEEIATAVEAAVIAAAAHRLKGSAGMMGLARISALAEALERACASGQDMQGHRLLLAESVRETRAALVGTGELAP